MNVIVPGGTLPASFGRYRATKLSWPTEDPVTIRAYFGTNRVRELSDGIDELSLKSLPAPDYIAFRYTLLSGEWVSSFTTAIEEAFVNGLRTGTGYANGIDAENIPRTLGKIGTETVVDRVSSTVVDVRLYDDAGLNLGVNDDLEIIPFDIPAGAMVGGVAPVHSQSFHVKPSKLTGADIFFTGYTYQYAPGGPGDSTYYDRLVGTLVVSQTNLDNAGLTGADFMDANFYFRYVSGTYGKEWIDVKIDSTDGVTEYSTAGVEDFTVAPWFHPSPAVWLVNTYPGTYHEAPAMGWYDNGSGITVFYNIRRGPGNSPFSLADNSPGYFIRSDSSEYTPSPTPTSSLESHPFHRGLLQFSCRVVPKKIDVLEAA